jgi:hypothetical protein
MISGSHCSAAAFILVPRNNRLKGFQQKEYRACAPYLYRHRAVDKDWEVVWGNPRRSD